MGTRNSHEFRYKVRYSSPMLFLARLFARKRLRERQGPRNALYLLEQFIAVLLDDPSGEGRPGVRLPHDQIVHGDRLAVVLRVEGKQLDFIGGARQLDRPV